MERKYRKLCLVPMGLLLILLCLVSYKSLSNTMNDNLYEGESPWESSIAIFIHKNAGKEVCWEYRESWGTSRGIWFEQNGMANDDGVVSFDCEGNQSEEEYSLNYHYKGTLEINDDYIVLTLLEGEKSEIIDGEEVYISINQLEPGDRSVILQRYIMKTETERR